MKYKHVEMVKEVRKWLQYVIIPGASVVISAKTINDLLKPQKENNTYDESKVIDYDWYMKNR